jgi:N6-adenosine-specific RNA methylase IME4
MTITNLPRNHFGAILADPPWKFEHWGKEYVCNRDPENHYPLLTIDAIRELPIGELAAENCVVFLWSTWPLLEQCLSAIKAWGFDYKTCGFCWMKANNTQPDFFQEELKVDMRLGYWTRANTEPCLLATRGKPKRLNADVRQGIIAPRREHSRKPDGIHERIERLVAGPYLELFARQTRAGWTSWGNEVGKFDPTRANERGVEWPMSG